MTISRRKFLKHGAVASAAAGTLGFPMIAKAQAAKTFHWKMTTAWPAGTPMYDTGPGSPRAFAERVAKMSGGRLNIKVFSAGELLPALEGFDAVSSGAVEMNHAVSYFWSGKTFAAQYFAAVPFGMSYL